MEHLDPEQRSDPNFVEKYLQGKLERYRKSLRYRIEGSISVEIVVAPSSRAAHEYFLWRMTTNTMDTKLMVRLYSKNKKVPGLGTMNIGGDFIRDNVLVLIRTDGQFSTEALPLAKKTDSAIKQQPPLTYQQLLSRRPIISIGPEVDTTTTEGQAIIPYDISVPAGQAVISVQAFVDGQHPTAKGGKIYLNVRRKRTRFTVKVTAITSELLVNTFERELIIPE